MADLLTPRLNELIRQVIEETELHDPNDIAARVAERTLSEEAWEWYQQMLPNQVRIIQGNLRRQHKWTWTPENKKEASRRGSKTKVDLRRSSWQKFLAASVHVDGGYKSRGDCTIEDLRFAAKERRVMAESFIVTATEYDKLAEAMAEYGAVQVRDLPESIGADFID